MKEKLKEVGLNDIPEEKKDIQGLYQYGLSNDTLDARVSLRNIPMPNLKYCTSNFSGTQNGPALQWYKVALDVFSGNDLNMYDSANNRIKITKAGRYLLIGSVDSRPTGLYTGTSIYVNGTQVSNFYQEMNGSVSYTRSITPTMIVVTLNVNDYVELYHYQSVNNIGIGTQSTYLQVQQIN